MIKEEKLQFHSNGECLTNYLRSFFEEGSYKLAYEFLISGGATEEIIKKFLRLEAKFIGEDTRNDDFAIVACDSEGDFSEFLMAGILTCLNSTKYKKFDYKIYELIEIAEEIVDIEYLLKMISNKEIIDLLYVNILNEEGYKLSECSLYNDDYGVILPNGKFVLCSYMEHHDLYCLLSKMGIASDSKWTDEHKCIHVSSGSIGGNIANIINSPENWAIEGYNGSMITEEQMNTLFDYRFSIKQVYSEFDTITENLRNFIVERNNKGGKYGNLKFLQRFYNDKINLPIFSDDINDIKSDKIFVRTSPYKSLPGLLNSKLINKNDDVNTIIEKIKSEYEKVKDVRDRNELHWFYQEFIEGDNGVCQYYKPDNKGHGEFEYSLSENQGDVVGGKIGNSTLEFDLYNKLRAIASMLYKDLNQAIQLEFVIRDNKIYIVQLRILENEFERTVLMNYPDNVLYQGITFSRGTIEVDVNDILIVDSEAKSEDLLGKKALIVKEKVAFSHILALSKALNIPSIYGIGDIDLTKYKKVKFIAYNKEAFICSI